MEAQKTHLELRTHHLVRTCLLENKDRNDCGMDTETVFIADRKDKEQDCYVQKERYDVAK